MLAAVGVAMLCAGFGPCTYRPAAWPTRANVNMLEDDANGPMWAETEESAITSEQEWTQGLVFSTSGVTPSSAPVQETASSLPPSIMDEREPSSILSLTATLGGKTLSLALAEEATMADLHAALAETFELPPETSLRILNKGKGKGGLFLPLASIDQGWRPHNVDESVVSVDTEAEAAAEAAAEAEAEAPVASSDVVMSALTAQQEALLAAANLCVTEAIQASDDSTTPDLAGLFDLCAARARGQQPQPAREAAAAPETMATESPGLLTSAITTLADFALSAADRALRDGWEKLSTTADDADASAPPQRTPTTAEATSRGRREQEETIQRLEASNRKLEQRMAMLEAREGRDAVE